MKVDKKTVALILAAVTPLIASICGWIDAHAEAKKSEKLYFVAVGEFEDYTAEKCECE